MTQIAFILYSAFLKLYFYVTSFIKLVSSLSPLPPASSFVGLIPHFVEFGLSSSSILPLSSSFSRLTPHFVDLKLKTNLFQKAKGHNVLDEQRKTASRLEAIISIITRADFSNCLILSAVKLWVRPCFMFFHAAR